MLKISSIFTLLISLTNIFSSQAYSQQIADTAFYYPISQPAHEKGTGTVITLDEAHYNFHSLSGRYFSFGKLLQEDGYVLSSGQEAFTASYLHSLKILVIANALPDTGEWRLPTNSAFTKVEISNVRDWVAKGGSLFLIADHMPFAGAAAQLAEAFGFHFMNGFALRKDEKPEFFSRKEKNLSSNTITNGRDSSEKIDSIRIFTGQAFKAPRAATIITTLDDQYEILLPSEAWEFDDTTPTISGKGFANGAYRKYKKGRILIMGEAAMFSAQLAGPQQNKMGMNHPDAGQNPQFLLNIIHWLDRKL